MNQLYILYAVSLLMDLSVAGTTFAITRRAAERGADAGTLGLLTAAWVLPYAGLALVTGRLSDRRGRRPVALVAPVLATTLAVVCAFTTRVPLLVALMLGYGVGVGFFWPVIIAWISDGAAGAVLHRRLTWFGVAWNIGLLTGFALTGYVFQFWPRAAFYVSATATGLVGLLLLIPARMPASVTETKPVGAAPPGRGFRKTAWLANFAALLASGALTAVFPQLATALGIQAGVHGTLLALARTAALGTLLVLEWAVFWRSRLWPLWVAQAVGVAAFIGIGCGSQVALFAGMFVLVGVVTGYTYQASIFFTQDEMADKGKGAGYHEAIVASGYFVGPIVAGSAGNLTGSLRAPYFVCAGVLALCVLLQIVVVAWRRKSAASLAR
jgi:MFS family permease